MDSIRNGLGRTRRVALGLVVGALGVGMMASGAAAGPYTNNSKLTAVSGQGEGGLSITSSAKPGELRKININAHVHDAGAGVTFSVQRGLDVTSDGTCDSLEFAELGTLTTSSGGAGAVHIERLSPSPSGDTFDVLFNLVGDDGSLLVSDCMVITLK
jgi:hypothetical protein